MGNVKALRCRECRQEYEPSLKYVCDECLGPLDVTYDYSRVRVSRSTFAGREKSYWRYLELLPVERSSVVSLDAGFTPLHRADRLGEALGLRHLYLKNDSVNPTFSFKDRPAGVAVSKAREMGLKAVGCASTGNLASATAAHAAKGDMPCYIFAPRDIEYAKIAQALAYGAEFIAVDGTYDDANRIAAQVADTKPIGIVNVNLRPYYVEGSKTLAYEVVEQLGWRVPDHLIVPVASGAMLNAICRGLEELHELNLVDGIDNARVTAAQAKGCSPVVDAFKKNRDEIVPVEYPNTIAKSLAIGDPGDGIYALRRLRQFHGYAEDPDDDEIRDAILLLARCEGIFTEPAGGVAVAALKRLVEDGRIGKDEHVVCYITGNGLKSIDAIEHLLKEPRIVKPNYMDVASMIAV
ncbi:MAG: threonine synthase [Candidatus Nitrosocaldus sp.]|nr:threonine synthase [Candidatus Nitrosocaldus sp.]MDW8000140.1 threonine synthase [Candidatus Nitrosocaldus sp.]